MGDSENIQKFLGTYTNSDFILAANELARMSKANFMEILKRKSNFTSQEHKKKIEALRLEFAAFVRTGLHLDESAITVKRTKVDDMVEDLWWLTTALVEKTANDQVRRILDAPCSLDDVLTRLCSIVAEKEAPDGVLHGMVDIIGKLIEDNKSLKRSVQNLSMSLKKAEAAQVTIKGDVEILKLESTKLSSFKYSSVKLASRSQQDSEAVLSAKRLRTSLSSPEDQDVVELNDKQDSWQTAGASRDKPAVLSYSKVLRGHGSQTQSRIQPHLTTVNTPNGATHGLRTAICVHDRSAHFSRPGLDSTKKPATVSRKPKFVLGTNLVAASLNNSGGVKAAVRRFHYYVGGWDLSVSEDSVKTYIEENIGTVLDIAELECKHQRFKSFRVTVEDVLDQAMLNPQKWVRNIRVKRFFFAKPKILAKQTPGPSSSFETNHKDSTDSGAVNAYSNNMDQ